MRNLLSKWLKIYPDEFGLFIWSTLLLFLIRSGNVLFDNFAETAFLKRFGVEYLPVVYMVNSITTFVLMGIVTGIMVKLPGSRLLAYMQLFCGLSVAALRLVIPLGFDYIYPLFFILKAQYEVLLGLVFWNLANDLFNTRQSKRLFPLITAGGVLGGVIGSFATPSLAKAITIDNILWIYLAVSMLGAFMVQRMGVRFPSILFIDSPDQEKGKKKKNRSSLIEEFKKVGPMIKESKLVKILVVLTLMPNIVIPIINYQFNFAADQQFATESGMLLFFGYFRGAMNVISLVILLFVGRIYGRWGLPVALMFHPFNYILAFLAFLFRFDILSAMYARISTTVLRNTINNPGRAVLVGLVHPAYRAVIRPFLRGTIVRIGTLAGSGIIMLCEGLIHPRFLSVIACTFVGIWLLATFILKRDYPKILLDLISRNMLDLKSIEGKELNQIFTDRKVRTELTEACASSRNDDCLWYARLLKSLDVSGLDDVILSALPQQDEKTRIALLAMLSPQAGEKAIPVLESLSAEAGPELMAAILQASNRLPAGLSRDFNLKVIDARQDPLIKAWAVAGLYPQAPSDYASIVADWFASGHLEGKKAAAIAAGGSGDGAYLPRLQKMLAKEDDPALLVLVLEAIRRLAPADINALVEPFLGHQEENVRMAALRAYVIADDAASRRAIRLLDDPSDLIHEYAAEKLQEAPYQSVELFLEFLTAPSRRVREGLFRVLETLDIKDLDVIRFARSQLQEAYTCLVVKDALLQQPESEQGRMLADHLEQKKDLLVENIIRLLAAQDTSGQMRLIWRGISSTNKTQRSNSIEALDSRIDASLSKILMPLLEGLSVSEALETGRKNYSLPRFNPSNPSDLYRYLLTSGDWVNVLFTLSLVAAQETPIVEKEHIQELTEADNPFVQRMAHHALRRLEGTGSERKDDMEEEITIPDKVLRLKGIQIFEGLSVNELAAIASVTEEIVVEPGEIVIREGESGDTLYLIIQGRVAVLKGYAEKAEGKEGVELAQISDGDYFGEMALFEDAPRSATIRTLDKSRLLVLHKREFTEIVREYPQIALHICRALSQRIRELHSKVRTG